MLVKDLIKLLTSLPTDSTIGTIDIYEYRLSQTPVVVNRNGRTYDSNGWQVDISEIESERKSNLDKICDYYII